MLEDIEVSTTAMCGQEVQRTNCSFKTVCVVSWQGWGKKEGDFAWRQSCSDNRMTAKQGLGEEKRLQHAEPLTGL